MSALGTAWLAVTVAPLNVNVPTRGGLTILTLERTSPSGSEKLKSPAVKV